MHLKLITMNNKKLSGRKEIVRLLRRSVLARAGKPRFIGKVFRFSVFFSF